MALGLASLLGQGALQFLPSLLGHLFGGNDPQQQYMKRVNAILAPDNMARLLNQYYQQNLGSPAFSQGQRAIAAGTNQTSNNVAQSLGARGLGTSGTGAILSSLTPSIAGSQMAGLYSGAYGNAQGMAQKSIQDQIAQLQQAYGQAGGGVIPGQNQQLFGAGIAGLGPLIEQFLRGRGIPQTNISPPMNQYGAMNNYGAQMPSGAPSYPGQ